MPLWNAANTTRLFRDRSTATIHPMSNDSLTSGFLAAVQPIVLVGGKSTRFGRDKLREPWGDARTTLVEHPIRSLRAVFGPRVKLVGDCHPDIIPLADGVIVDIHPGIGPMGGIVSALRSCSGPIFVLAGDMPGFTAADVRGILRIAQERQDARAVLAATDRQHPCAGLYAQACLPILLQRVSRQDFTLSDAIPAELVHRVAVPPASAANVNMPP